MITSNDGSIGVSGKSCKMHSAAIEHVRIVLMVFWLEKSDVKDKYLKQFYLEVDAFFHYAMEWPRGDITSYYFYGKLRLELGA